MRTRRLRSVVAALFAGLGTPQAIDVLESAAASGRRGVRRRAGRACKDS